MSLIALILAAALQPTTTVSEAVVEPSRAAESPVVCRREVVTGSNKRLKVCRSQAAIDNETFNAKRYLDRRMQNGARTRSQMGLGHVRQGDPKS